MESGINLLPEITEKEIKAGVYQKKVNIVALGSLGAVAIIIVALIGYQVVLAANASGIENRSKEAQDRIIKNSSIEIAYSATKEKLDKIDQILTAEIPSSKLIDQVNAAAQTSQPISIQGLSIQSDGTVLVDGLAANSDIFKEWINNLTGEAGKDYFSKINIVSLAVDSGGYKFSFRMNFLKKGVFEIK